MDHTLFAVRGSESATISVAPVDPRWDVQDYTDVASQRCCDRAGRSRDRARTGLDESHRRGIRSLAWPVMLGETRILFFFPSQPAPRPVGCVALFDAAVADRRLGCYCNSVSKATPTAPTYFLTYIHDCYPAHEVYIGHKLIWPWSPNDHSIGNIAACLSGAREPISGSDSGPIN
jgi:hypothetical protein